MIGFLPILIPALAAAFGIGNAISGAVQKNREQDFMYKEAKRKALLEFLGLPYAPKQAPQPGALHHILEAGATLAPLAGGFMGGLGGTSTLGMGLAKQSSKMDTGLRELPGFDPLTLQGIANGYNPEPYNMAADDALPRLPRIDRLSERLFPYPSSTPRSRHRALY